MFLLHIIKEAEIYYAQLWFFLAKISLFVESFCTGSSSTDSPRLQGTKQKTAAVDERGIPRQPRLGLRASRKSISMDDLRTPNVTELKSPNPVAQDDLQMGRGMQSSRNFNQSFRVAVDKSYDGLHTPRPTNGTNKILVVNFLHGDSESSFTKM